MKSSSVIKLSKSALQNNLRLINKLAGKAKVSLVVKGNAYGHGLAKYVKMAEECGADHFSTYSYEEALSVRKHTKNNPTIMIMGYIDNSYLKDCIKKGIEFYVFNFYRLNRAIREAKKLNKKAKVHVEVETGLNRTGFHEKELNELVETLKENKDYLEVKGLCTHYAGAESISNYYRIKGQIKRFKKYTRFFKNNEIYAEKYHTCSSAGTILYPKTRFDLVRIGILQYGGWPSVETYVHYLTNRKNKKNPLKPVLSWESCIMNIKHVRAGEYIGYGNHYLAQEDMKIATVPVGYTEGYSRVLGNQSQVIIKGKAVNVIGVINMNLLIVDITSFENIKIGEKVTLVGKDGDQAINFSSFSSKGKELNYEVLSRLPEKIPRKIVD